MKIIAITIIRSSPLGLADTIRNVNIHQLSDLFDSGKFPQRSDLMHKYGCSYSFDNTNLTWWIMEDLHSRKYQFYRNSDYGCVGTIIPIFVKEEFVNCVKKIQRKEKLEQILK